MTTRKILFAALVTLSLAGLLLHYRVHSFMVPDKVNAATLVFDSARFLSFAFSVTDVLVVTALFALRKTMVYGFLLNGMLVIYGTVFMAHFSIAEISAKALPAGDWLVKSTLPDIGIAWADFFVGRALYEITVKG